ncbi:Head-to-tail connector protein, podovirus-type [uncultured Caudovirales phage]|uniref:Head-to-tail connector protein, podovirus-type n=1 Tax=uncultured Caudovirales phage TaxID=2100421 RepID=A0A6J5T6F6_9CAUD|nr:Head-to-tail connector protein, podovirus-type [uncultured Caudovirales phage]
MKAKEAWEIGMGLFAKRSSLLLLWQETAENFYPERADFTYHRSLGTDYAGNLMSSYPLLCRRDLGDQTGTMLRPTAKPWFAMGLPEDEREDNESTRWMQRSTKIMRRAMYDPKALFTKATKEGDHDWATFGQCVITCRLNKTGDSLLYRCWHLRDVAWLENEEGKIGQIYRKWKPTARDLVNLFGRDAVHQNVRQKVDQNKPNEEFEIIHMMIEADMYSPDKAVRTKHEYFSIYYDATNEHIIEEVNTWNMEYIIPRWQTVSGSQYAFSPATVAALPESRLLQSIAYTLLEAGEKAVNPPMVGTQDVVRSDVAVFAGGITWVDRDYDERLGEALRLMNIDSKNMPLGLEMMQDSRSMIQQCFYLNKLNLPQRAPEMTAYEVGQRVQEYIRNALPLFEPMEMEYNGAICDRTFEILRRHGGFGAPTEIPKSLLGRDILFKFESPLHDAIEELEGHKFLEMGQYLATAVQLDPSTQALPDAQTALRDALTGIKVPARWMRSEITVQQITDQAKQAAQAKAQLANLEQASNVAVNAATAQKNAAQAVPA